jgi:hypothetical protein
MPATRLNPTLLAFCLLTGCATGGVVSISEPNIRSTKEQPVSLDADGVLRIAGLSVSVKPQNARVGLLTVGPIVPLIPLGAGNELGKGSAFRIVVQLDASDAAYTFTPADTVLVHAGAQYRPTESVGPLINISVPRELERASPGHDWVCSNARTARHPTVLAQDMAVPLSKSCFVLQFPVITPSPDQPFDLELRGLKKDGKEIDVPRIEFRPGTTGAYSILGSVRSDRCRLVSRARVGCT